MTQDPGGRGYDTGAIAAGLAFIVLGIVFLFDALEVFEVAPAVLWPLLLIALGAAVLLGGRRIGGS